VTSEWFRNGEAVQAVAIDDRAFQYGDGLFETIAIRAGEPRLWDYHMDRLAAGCACLGLAMPDPGGLRRQIDAALHRATAEAAFCVAKIIVSAGISQRGYGRPQGTDSATWVGLFPAAPLPASVYLEGVDTIICKTRLGVGSPVAGVKSLNRLEQVLARSECLSVNAFEGLTLDAEGYVICGTMSNVFLVRNSSVITPLLSRCGVPGVMRRHVMSTLQAIGRSVEELDIREPELHAADEVFLSNSQFGVIPVRRCDDTPWSVGVLTRELLAALAESGIVECRA
jgi:4-amino-4-deoxychorismate lyase